MTAAGKRPSRASGRLQPHGRRSRMHLAALLLAAFAAHPASAQRTPIALPRAVRTRAPEQAPRVCQRAGDRQDTLAVSRLPLDAASLGNARYRGPRTYAVAVDADEWRRIWAVVSDSAPVPSVDFTRHAVVIVATEVLSTGPSTLAIDRAVRCHGYGEIAVLLRMHDSPLRLDNWERTVRAVLVPRRAIAAGPVRFVELPRVVDLGAATTP